MKWLKKVAATPLTSIARVVDNLNVTTNSRTNAPSIRAVREAFENKWETIYPIGSVYISVSSEFDPSIAFGGTWQQIKDRFLLSRRIRRVRAHRTQTNNRSEPAAATGYKDPK